MDAQTHLAKDMGPVMSDIERPHTAPRSARPPGDAPTLATKLGSDNKDIDTQLTLVKRCVNTNIRIIVNAPGKLFMNQILFC